VRAVRLGQVRTRIADSADPDLRPTWYGASDGAGLRPAAGSGHGGAAGIPYLAGGSADRAVHGAYRTGDTGPNDALVQLARGADLLLSEAALEDNDPHNPGDLHLTPADAGEQAKKAGVKRLVITHVPPWYNRETQAENARRTYPGRVDIATPHAVFDI
jgi:hypothetical protein